MDRIEVTAKSVRWWQNDKLIAEGNNTDQQAGGYFGIRQKRERGTRYDDVSITIEAAR